MFKYCIVNILDSENSEIIIDDFYIEDIHEARMLAWFLQLAKIPHEIQCPGLVEGLWETSEDFAPVVIDTDCWPETCHEDQLWWDFPYHLEPLVVDFNKAFNTQRPLLKKEVLKLKAGTWIELRYRDAPNSAVLLLEKPTSSAGDASLKVFYPDTGRCDEHPVHSQVVRVLGPLQVPTL
jgi:hypothetical protein